MNQYQEILYSTKKHEKFLAREDARDLTFDEITFCH